MNHTLEVSEDNLFKISWGAIVFLITLIFGFGAWMTSQEIRAQTNADEIVKIHGETSSVQDTLNTIDKRLTRIEFLLEEQKINRKKGD
jgi:hypothetical protein